MGWRTYDSIDCNVEVDLSDIINNNFSEVLSYFTTDELIEEINQRKKDPSSFNKLHKIIRNGFKNIIIDGNVDTYDVLDNINNTELLSEVKNRHLWYDIKKESLKLLIDDTMSINDVLGAYFSILPSAFSKKELLDMVNNELS